MSSNSIFSVQPTFTQGLILGQLSILILLGLILKYLFLDSAESPFEKSTYHPHVDSDPQLKGRQHSALGIDSSSDSEAENSVEWLNVLLIQLADVYRSGLRNHLSGPDGDEIARKRIEEFANKFRPQGLIDHIQVHSIELGHSAPRIYNGRKVRSENSGTSLDQIQFDLSYLDTVSLSMSTSCLFNYPLPSFARLPVSLTVSLTLFKSSITITTPSPQSRSPVLEVTMQPNFTLNLSITSLMGSRAKLANVPKLHELIQHQVRRLLLSSAKWKIALPGVPDVCSVTPDVLKVVKEGDLR